MTSNNIHFLLFQLAYMCVTILNGLSSEIKRLNLVEKRLQAVKTLTEKVVKKEQKLI